MDINEEILRELLNARENQRLEFKEARNQYSFEKLEKYCVALANEGGGKLILGVSDVLPRCIVGSRAFQDLDNTKSKLIQQLRIRIDATEYLHPDGRVVIFNIPSRPLGQALSYRGSFLMRAGSSLAPMTQDMLREIFDEDVIDFSAQCCSGAQMQDLDIEAIKAFQHMWYRKSGNSGLLGLDVEQVLVDAELIMDDCITYAALVLFGTERSLGKYLPQAEIVLEYRSSEASGPAAQRREFREGFFLFQDKLWEVINARNDIQHFQQGFFVFDIPTFSELAIREAILNAVSHREYRHPNSVFIRQYERRLEVESPGGLPPGVTVENILYRQQPRNRRLAESFSKCGLVERSGQGVNLMFEESIKESKPLPDYAKTDDYQVDLVLDGEVQDPGFLRYLEQIGREKLAMFTTRDFLILDYIRRDEDIPSDLHERRQRLTELGIIERIGRGRGTRYILSRQFYEYLGQKGVYTARRGLDRDTNKALLLKHISDNASTGCPLHELCQVLPKLTNGQVQTLLRDLKSEGKIHCVGRTRGAKWFPGIG